MSSFSLFSLLNCQSINGFFMFLTSTLRKTFWCALCARFILVFKMAQTGRSFSAEKWRTPKRAVAHFAQLWLTGLFQRMRHMAHTPKVYKSEMTDVFYSWNTMFHLNYFETRLFSFIETKRNHFQSDNLTQNTFIYAESISTNCAENVYISRNESDMSRFGAHSRFYGRNVSRFG